MNSGNGSRLQINPDLEYSKTPDISASSNYLKPKSANYLEQKSLTPTMNNVKLFNDKNKPEFSVIEPSFISESEIKRNSLRGAAAPNYDYYRKLYETHKNPIQSFLQNFSRALLFTINIVSSQANQDVDVLSKRTKKAFASRIGNRKTTQEANIFKNKRILLEKSILEGNDEFSEILEESEISFNEKINPPISTKNSLAIPLNSESLREKIIKEKSLLEKSPITIMKEKLNAEEENAKAESDREKIQKTKTDMRRNSKLLNVSKSYSKRVNYDKLSFTKAAISVIKKPQDEESSSYSDQSFEGSVTSSQASSYSESEESDSLDFRKSSNNYARYSAIYELKHLDLVKNLAKVIFDAKAHQSVQIPLMKNFSIIHKENSNIDEIIKKLRIEEISKDSESRENNDDVNARKLEVYKDESPENYLFFTNNLPTFPNQESTKVNEKLLVEQESDYDSMQRILLKNKFLERSSKIHGKFNDEFAYIQILPTEENISEKYKIACATNLDHTKSKQQGAAKHPVKQVKWRK